MASRFWGYFGWGTPETENKEENTDDSSDDIVQVTTENGAVSYSTTGDARLDLFGKVCRDTEEEQLYALLDASWLVDPLDTLRIIFYLRDCRGGMGEREQFFRALRWLGNQSLQTLIRNMCHVPFYGRYKDLLEIAARTTRPSVRVTAYSIFAKQLTIDKELIDTQYAHKITLAGKYAPSERGSYDKKSCAVSELCFLLGCDKKTYRKEYLSPLRKAVKVVERQMTDLPEDWHSINFSHVPSVALKKYAKAWKRHEGGRYESWLDDVKQGKAKMNVLRLMPHQIVSPYFKKGVKTIQPSDHLVETQWAAFVDQTRKSFTKQDGISSRVVSVIDTSDSMFRCGAIKIALSLGLVLAELTEGPYKNQFITFSEAPVVETIEGDSLNEKLRGMTTAHWENTTNIQAVYDLILEGMRTSGKTVDDVFVFSDMKWDIAVDNDAPNWEVLDEKFAKHGLKRPRFIFWNLDGKTFDFPIPSTAERACYISGFSTDILKAILEGRELSPVDLMLSIIRSERYSRLSIP